MRKDVRKYTIKSGSFYLLNGLFHRLDGPAIERNDGGYEWWIMDKKLTHEDWLKHPMVIEHNIGKIINEVLDEDKT